MNKYAARGIMLDAIDGKRILVLTVGVHEITHVLGELEAQLDDSVPARVTRISNRAGISVTDRGRVAVKSWRQSLRGASYDTIYLDTGVDAEIRSIDQLRQLDLVVPTAPHGAIVRA